MPKGAAVMRVLGNFIGLTESTHQSVQTILHCALAEDLVPGAFYSQHYYSKYRDGSSGGWPMTSPNPLVTAEAAAKLETITYAALGLPAPQGPQKPKAARDSDNGAVPSTPATAEALD